MVIPKENQADLVGPVCGGGGQFSMIPMEMLNLDQLLRSADKLAKWCSLWISNKDWKIPSLVELCVRTTIDNIRYLGDVGDTDIDLLKDILPHCTVDQLMLVEKSSEGRDLSPATDNLWKKFYEQHFGLENTNVVIRRMKQKQVVFKWRLLYETKMKERNLAQKKSAELLKKKYAEEGAKKQSRQIRICSKIPPSSKKRSFLGGAGAGSSFSKVKGNLMKKARLESLQSHEAKIHEAMRKNALQRKSFSTPSVSRTMKPSGFLGSSSASSSKLSKPFARAH
ncbi:transcription elongation factor B polypeptide [Tasmannia lanceolata]|uniref:transcription elongation factor B polypeptide n=1 Tax=Tasmannia lanceolata TaxID=3420 RepID=UPI0040633D02